MFAQKLDRETADKIAREWFAKVDVLNVDGTMSLCDEDSVVTFGNHASVQGDANLRDMFSSWYQFFDRMKHDVFNINVDTEHNTVFIDSRVSYYLKANKSVSPVVIPAMSVMRFKPWGGNGLPKFADFRVYFDCSPVTSLF